MKNNNKKFVMIKKSTLVMLTLSLFVFIMVAINSKITLNRVTKEFSLELEKMGKRVEEIVLDVASLKGNVVYASSDFSTYSASSITYEEDIEMVELFPEVKEPTEVHPYFLPPIYMTVQELIESNIQEEFLLNIEEDVQEYNELDIIADEPEVEIEVVEIEEINEILQVSNKAITEPTGMTAEQFNEIIEYALNDKNKKNSGLANTGEAFVYIEEEYGINGLFALAVASFESGWGEKYIRANKNLTGASSGNIKYESEIACLKDFGRFIDEGYISQGLTSVSSIAPKYCPPQSSKWTSNVNWFLNYYRGVADNSILS